MPAAAIRQGLAGPTTWLVVALFAVESIGYVIGYMGLRTVTPGELESALKKTETA